MIFQGSWVWGLVPWGLCGTFVFLPRGFRKAFRRVHGAVSGCRA